MPHHRQTPGLRDELITDDLAALLAELDPAQLDRKPLKDAEALERLGKHLLGVARRLRNPSGRDDVAEAGRPGELSRQALGPTFLGDRVAGPPEVLLGIRPPANLSDGSLPAHPRIPLTSSELLVNGAGEPSFGAVLKEEIRCADEVDLICAFVGYTGFQPLRDELRSLVERGGRVRVITSTYLGSTSGKALDELRATRR